MSSPSSSESSLSRSADRDGDSFFTFLVEKLTCDGAGEGAGEGVGDRDIGITTCGGGDGDGENVKSGENRIGEFWCSRGIAVLKENGASWRESGEWAGLSSFGSGEGRGDGDKERTGEATVL